MVVLRSPIHANEDYDLYSIVKHYVGCAVEHAFVCTWLICMNGTSQYHHYHKISRFLDFDDWSIDDFSFNIIDNLWGPHTVDRFASPHNNKLTVFNARFWCRGVSGVDAFCQDWHADNNYLCPPVSLIVEAIKRMQSCAAIGTLIVPKWTTAYFWPFIGSGGIEKSHSCKWAKWIQWHALPHIQQSTQQWNKGYYPNLHGWDFSIPPSPIYLSRRFSFEYSCTWLAIDAYQLFTPLFGY